MIKNLVFKGGGVLGIAYAGAFQVLEEKKILAQVQRVAGTSAGAITAALISLKYTSNEIIHVVGTTDFKSFEDGWNPLRIATKYGLYKGDAFLTWMRKCITNKGLQATATFADFKKAGMLDLHVFAADLNSRSLKEFSVTKTPNTIVAEAIRASVSIPLFFEAWSFSNAIPDNHIYVDGGTIYNFPISTFDNADGTVNPETLGFYLKNVNSTNPPSNLQHDQLLQFIKDLFETLTDSQAIDFETESEDKKRTVIIDDFGISATNFALTDAQKMQLYNSGKIATTTYLANHNIGV
jgi:NTE family protein